MNRRRGAVRAVAAIVAVLASACSSGESASVESDPIDQTATTISEADEDLFTQREQVTAIDDDGQPVEPVTESLAPVAETGVPGIDSDDSFCRSWSTYAGSFQALSLAWALQPPTDAARLEVAASSAISEAVDGMGAGLPTEIETNRQALTVDVPGPLLRRADRAAELLAEAGLDSARIEALGDTWIAAVAEQGIETETLAIDVPADTADALSSAAGAFAAELPSLIEDPTLDTTEFDISPSLDYIAANCPDQATLAGNDVIDSGGT